MFYKSSTCLLALIGNPNVGKTTLFNTLTNSNEHTGNWHGVTVAEKEKVVRFDNKIFKVIDLPGIYSLSPYSREEEVAVDYLLSHDLSVINICDANVLERNLYLTLSLLECGINPTIVVNFDNEVVKSGTIYDYKKLSQILGIGIIKNDFKAFSEFYKKISHLGQTQKNITLPYLKFLPIFEVLEVLNPQQLDRFHGKENYVSIKLLEKDEFVMDKLNLSEEQMKKLQSIQQRKDYMTYIAKLRYDFICSTLQSCTKSHTHKVYGKHKIDKFILNKYLAIPIFFLILCGIFYVTFSSLGAYLSEGIKFLIDNYVGVPLKNLLQLIHAPAWIMGLVIDGIIGGVGGIFSFIPQIVLLFFFLSILEDSGYISRLAFSFEEIFYKFGLSGKSVFTLLMSFGCTTSSILTTRTIEDKNTRIKTAMISPYMSCSAKLPIYAVIGGAFFGKGNIFIIVGLYMLGVVVALLVSRLLSKGKLKSGEVSFILEFPPYRFPSVKRIFNLIYENCKLFVVKVFTILLSFSVIVWIMQNFSFRFEYLPSTLNSQSMLQTIGTFLTPLFAPIGLDNWGVVVSLLVGIMAKEMVVGTMAIINKIPPSSDFNRELGMSLLSTSYIISFTPATAVVMLVFSLLYLPCISTIAVMKKEIGAKMTFLSCTMQLVVTYSLCLVLYNLLTGGFMTRLLVILGLIIAIIAILIYSYKLTKRKGHCLNCIQNCSKKHFIK